MADWLGRYTFDQRGAGGTARRDWYIKNTTEKHTQTSFRSIYQWYYDNFFASNIGLDLNNLWVVSIATQEGDELFLEMLRKEAARFDVESTGIDEFGDVRNRGGMSMVKMVDETWKNNTKQIPPIYNIENWGSNNVLIAVNKVSLPSDMIKTKNVEMGNGYTWVPPMLADRHDPFTPLQLTFYYTTYPFSEFIVRPWMMAINRYGLKLRSTRAHITCTLFTKRNPLDKTVNWFPKFQYKFYSCYPLGVPQVDFAYDNDALEKSGTIQFGYDYYKITIPDSRYYDWGGENRTLDTHPGPGVEEFNKEVWNGTSTKSKYNDLEIILDKTFDEPPFTEEKSFESNVWNRRPISQTDTRTPARVLEDFTNNPSGDEFIRKPEDKIIREAVGDTLRTNKAGDEPPFNNDSTFQTRIWEKRWGEGPDAGRSPSDVLTDFVTASAEDQFRESRYVEEQLSIFERTRKIISDEAWPFGLNAPTINDSVGSELKNTTSADEFTARRLFVADGVPDNLHVDDTPTEDAVAINESVGAELKGTVSADEFLELPKADESSEEVDLYLTDTPVSVEANGLNVAEEDTPARESVKPARLLVSENDTPTRESVKPEALNVGENDTPTTVEPEALTVEESDVPTSESIKPDVLAVEASDTPASANATQLDVPEADTPTEANATTLDVPEFDTPKKANVTKLNVPEADTPTEANATKLDVPEADTPKGANSESLNVSKYDEPINESVVNDTTLLFPDESDVPASFLFNYIQLPIPTYLDETWFPYMFMFQGLVPRFDEPRFSNHLVVPGFPFFVKHLITPGFVNPFDEPMYIENRRIRVDSNDEANRVKSSKVSVNPDDEANSVKEDGLLVDPRDEATDAFLVGGLVEVPDEPGDSNSRMLLVPVNDEPDDSDILLFNVPEDEPNGIQNTDGAVDANDEPGDFSIGAGGIGEDEPKVDNSAVGDIGEDEPSGIGSNGGALGPSDEPAGASFNGGEVDSEDESTASLPVGLGEVFEDEPATKEVKLGEVSDDEPVLSFDGLTVSDKEPNPTFVGGLVSEDEPKSSVATEEKSISDDDIITIGSVLDEG